MSLASTQFESPIVLVFGNEKGGTGKSTLAMHVLVALLYENYRIASIDVDGRQGTLSRYIENRKFYGDKHQAPLSLPTHTRLFKDELMGHEEAALDKVFELSKDFDFILIDTPGSDTTLSQKAHARADMLITPLNDSFIDLDLLVRLDDKGGTPTLAPSTYAEMVWEQRKQKIQKTEVPMEWVVVKNRLGHLLTKNKEQVDNVLQKLSTRIGFTLASGFGERVIFRELFLKGLTLLDLKHLGHTLTFSHAAARQELRALMNLIPRPSLITQQAS